MLYIPHGSDESINALELAVRIQMLYIPHGSDESTHRDSNEGMGACFISHMVQMKVLAGMLTLSFKIKLYIPHGSDERCAWVCAEI